jgi:hypothetical protein
MPARGLRELERQKGSALTIEDLASQFDVSEDAARIRLDIFTQYGHQLL